MTEKTSRPIPPHTVTNTSPSTRALGLRIRAAREALNLTQETLSNKLGFNDRQTLSNIEAGKRKVSADELIALISALKRPLEFFTDPFILVGEGSFSWRASTDGATLHDFQEQAGRWIALYRFLREKSGAHAPLFVQQLPLTKNSSYEEAQNCGEQLAIEWQLGDIPSERLHQEIEERLNTLVLFVDAPAGISGAACQLTQVNAILVNRRENVGRRAYDLAHELFHILTWDKMPPAKIDPFYESEQKKNRVEALAENFAGALLMPEHVVRSIFAKRSKNRDINYWLNSTASALGVSSKALLWRARDLDLVDVSERAAVKPALLINNGEFTKTSNIPPLFSKKFVRELAQGIDRGLISVAKAEGVLGLDRSTHRQLYREYSLEIPFDM
jgi:Zn-dependent peptidase ImmA (M78 family)/DNA-binding XRE family transcriptional regulator